MDALFMNLANIIKEQPMPEEFKDVRSVVLCNDCSAKCSTAYHFLGLRCEICQSYNTVELDRSPMPGDRFYSDQQPGQADPSQSELPSTIHRSQGVAPSADQTQRSPLATRLLNGTTHNNNPSNGNLRFAEPELNLANEEEEEEEEEFDFWGREVRSDRSGSEREDEDTNSSDDVDGSEIDEEYEDEDEDNVDEYDIVLLGHR